MDNREFWAVQRDRAVESGPKTIALLGASRMQVGISPGVMKEILKPWEVVQLAIDGRYPLATLEDLALDESFTGVVVCSILPPAFDPNHRDDQQDYIRYHDQASISDRVNGICLRWLQTRFVALSPVLNPMRVGARLLKRGALPVAGYVRVNEDRSRTVDYSKIDVTSQRQGRIDRASEEYSHGVLSPEEWLKEVKVVDQAVKKIQSRGGKVVFVRFPTTGEHLDLDKKYYPRDLYWDRLPEVTSATTIHFEDVPSMNGYDCPDSSHLSSADVPRFTKALAEELQKKGVI